MTDASTLPTVDEKWHAATRAELRSQGTSRRAIDEAVREGRLIRARRDRYVEADVPSLIREAVRVGGRLTCLSLLQLLGVFVYRSDVPHIHIRRGSSRLRSPEDRSRRLAPRPARRARLHWMPLIDESAGTSACVGISDALAHSVLCQPARHAVATLDSALNRGLITTTDLDEIFATLPKRYRVLAGLTDARARSGTETLVRLMVRSLGCAVDLQVAFVGVGFVDLVVDGWLVIECDSREFHGDWKAQVADRARDMALAAHGYCVLRLIAADILSEPEKVLAALRGLVSAHRRAAGLGDAARTTRPL